MRTIQITVNGVRHDRSVGPRLLLVHFLRNVLARRAITRAARL